MHPRYPRPSVLRDWWQTTFPQGQQTLTLSHRGEPVKLAYGEVGSGKPLLLVHGLGSWSFGWRHAIAPLAKHYRVIVYDASGNGFSEKSSQWDITQLPQELRQVIQHLCDEPVTVVAQSLGALIALDAAIAQPELFARLIAINVPLYPQRLPGLGMRLLDGFPLPLIEWVDRLGWVRPLSPLLREVVKYFRREVVTNPDLIDDEEIYWITYPYVARQGTISHFALSLRQITREIQRLERGQPSLVSEVQAKVGQIGQPTLILWSEGDRWFPVSDGEKLHAQMPNSRLQILPGCGHDAAGSCPERVMAAMLSFLQESDRS